MALDGVNPFQVISAKPPVAGGNVDRAALTSQLVGNGLGDRFGQDVNLYGNTGQGPNLGIDA